MKPDMSCLCRFDLAEFRFMSSQMHSCGSDEIVLVGGDFFYVIFCGFGVFLCCFGEDFVVQRPELLEDSCPKYETLMASHFFWMNDSWYFRIFLKVVKFVQICTWRRLYSDLIEVSLLKPP